jgi:hypothetical protein
MGMARQPKITSGEMREMGIRGLLVYCADYRCSHSIELSPAEIDKWSDIVRLSDLDRSLSASHQARPRSG